MFVEKAGERFCLLKEPSLSRRLAKDFYAYLSTNRDLLGSKSVAKPHESFSLFTKLAKAFNKYKKEPSLLRKLTEAFTLYFSTDMGSV